MFGNFGDDTLVVKIHLIVEPDIGHKRQSEAERNACRDAMTLQIIDEQQTVVGRDAAVEPTWMYSRRLCVRPDSDSLIAFITPSNT